MSELCVCGQTLASTNGTGFKQHKRSVLHRNYKRIKALLANDCMTYQEIGERVGVSKQRILQIREMIDPNYEPNHSRQMVCTIKRHNQSRAEGVEKSVNDSRMLSTLKKIAAQHGLSFTPIGSLRNSKWRAKTSRVLISGHLCSLGSTSLTYWADNFWYHFSTHPTTDIECTFHIRLLKEDMIWMVIPSPIPSPLSRSIYILLEHYRKKDACFPLRTDWTQYFNAWHLLRDGKQC